MSRLNKFYMSEDQHMDRGESILTNEIECQIKELTTFKFTQYRRIFESVHEIGAVLSWYDVDSDLKEWGLMVSRVTSEYVELVSEDDMSYFIDFDSIVSIETTGEIITQNKD